MNLTLNSFVVTYKPTKRQETAVQIQVYVHMYYVVFFQSQIQHKIRTHELSRFWYSQSN